MRNAAATFDDDLAGSSRKGAGRPRSAPRRGKKKTRRAPFDLQGVARYAAIGMAATVALGIIVNALLLQKGHHPAPLFASGKPAAASTPPAVAAKVAIAAPAVQQPAQAGTEPAKSRKTAAPHAADATEGDAIGRLLAGDLPHAGVRGKAVAASTATDAKAGNARTVSGAQRALTKLGFKVPATGTLGPATRKALEAWQKDRHLPVKGELDGRMVRLLSAQSGMAID